jgi:hypothetical protein
MKITAIKRWFKMPFSKFESQKALYKNIMTPEEIQAEEKRLHELYLLANKKGQKAQEQEYMYKRDALRKVLKINV